jgi:hypothetical protein
MNLAETKDILTTVGAALGAFAFFQNFLKPMSAANKERMKFIEENIISDLDFENLGHSAWYSHSINLETLFKLDSLVDRFEKGSPGVAFKTLVLNPYAKRLRQISKTHRKYRDLVQVPYWDYVVGAPSGLRVMQKDVFYKNANTQILVGEADKKYQRHLEEVHDYMAQMQASFRELRKLAMRDDFEYFLPWKWRVKVKPISH